MNNRKVYISGEIVPEVDAKISIFDSAVLLGDTVTESTRTFNFKPFKLDEHLERLYKSFKLTRIDPQMTIEEMKKVSLELLEINKDNYKANEDCWLVHNISRGHSITGGNPALQVSKPTVMIYTQPMNLVLWAPFYTKGCHAVTPPTRMVPSQSLDARIKNRSRLFYTLAEIEAKLVDPDAQSVILDIHGNVAENKGGNIFMIKDGKLITPTTANCLEGLTRNSTMEIARSLDIEVIEAVIQSYDLATSDEMFITSTPYSIMPATKFNGMPIADGNVGPVTKKLIQGWSDRVGRRYY
ncbi:MAG: branched chain amino acid aminotransferase [Alphaproteobacteria bacterium]|nr:MAG: branched chain amino acid aminotransferase [Alphaproteobacteria bacterium]